MGASNVRKVFFEEIQTGGRPKYILNKDGMEEIERLAGHGNTDEDIAYIMGVSVDLLTNDNNREAFKEAKKRGFSKLRGSLREMEVKKALKGNTALLIFMAKNVLGQSDNPQPVVKENEIKDDPLTLAIMGSMNMEDDNDELLSDQLPTDESSENDADIESE